MIFVPYNFELETSLKSESKVISVETAWTLTNILHGVMVYLFMHTVKGTPFHTSDQGSSRFLTAWEQIDGEIQVQCMSEQSRTNFCVTSHILLVLSPIIHIFSVYESEKILLCSTSCIISPM